MIKIIDQYGYATETLINEFHTRLRKAASSADVFKLLDVLFKLRVSISQLL